MVLKTIKAHLNIAVGVDEWYKARGKHSNGAKVGDANPAGYIFSF